MKKYLLLILIIVACLNNIKGQEFIRNIKKSVTFLFVQNENGELLAVGTGFFVQRDTLLKKAAVKGFLVTARHVLTDSLGNIYNNIYARVNKKDGTSGFVQYRIQVGWNTFFHKDSSVDIAIISGVPTDIYDLQLNPINLFITKDEIRNGNISEGSDVFFSGLFTSYIGEKHNYPIIRFGKIALISKEKIPWKRGLADLILVETTVYGGNSGSPIYVAKIKDPNTNRWPYEADKFELLGIMIGYFYNESKIGIHESKVKVYSEENMGISAVVPIYLLKEMFDYDEVINARL